MKKQQYIAAVACLVAGAIGFASVYATEKNQEKRNDSDYAVQQESTEQLSAASYEIKPKTDKQAEAAPEIENDAVKVSEKEKPQTEAMEENEDNAKKTEKTKTVATAEENSLHFDTKKGMQWPLEGEILLDYSMDATVYFPTLEQYRYNPAIVISAAVNDKVNAVAKGKITDISENEVTGCTVKQDLGDGYTVIYGQLKELNFKKGDMVEAGQTIGYVGEPTKYYSTEGSNVYFELQKDGKPVNPKEYLPEMPMNTLD